MSREVALDDRRNKDISAGHNRISPTQIESNETTKRKGYLRRGSPACRNGSKRVEEVLNQALQKDHL